MDGVMARSREESRSELTQQAVQQGVEVTPGQLETIGMAQQGGWHSPQQPASVVGGRYFRLRLINSAVQDPGAPDHVVCAADVANARDTFRAELGITTIDEMVNKVEISEATEDDYQKAQLKRLGEAGYIKQRAKLQGIDLQERRKVKQADGSPLPSDDPEYGKLLWAPEGHQPTQEYWVWDNGEVRAEKQARRR